MMNNMPPFVFARPKCQKLNNKKKRKNLNQAKRFVASMGPPDEEAMVLKKIAELNLGQNTSAFSKFGCKNAGFVEAMVLRGTNLHRGGFELTEVK